ncbi:O-acetyl-ADP-ribose deacetylase [Alteribacillus iranensis]|uniref:O-acetyl-ADP-ribose deacetylase (Regulator of RNase III), contains Macro domain n=1 Tax=Alteribacillus iranensis TaxID=930128 RepID=A0A1I2ABH0_9BACI|nr:O-acetyl-ADP-ribose deacetylase [Alteribacillus iranensis]SFE41355.1 O-acetyl-ADP-ribose deacetylase (regulator of RNase III), contains Macro domain [Alteribacillus iranensis]
MKAKINGNTLELITGDITQFSTDVMVNAANGTLMGGGGVDGAIHRAAGEELLEECKAVRNNQLHGDLLPTGEAIMTRGYNLPAKYVIHTVGPVWGEHSGEEAALLAKCYSHSLLLSFEKNMKRISFPSISTGVYGYPVEKASIVAIQTIGEFLKSNEFGKVTMVLFSREDYETYVAALEEYLSEWNK